MTEKRFKVEVSSDNYVHFTENGVNVISIGFKEYADAESCKYSLLPFCNRLNELEDENRELKEQLKNCIKKAKEEIRQEEENNAIIWANIGR